MSCSSLNTNRSSKDRSPSSITNYECGPIGVANYHFFNGRRLLGLNKIIDSHRKKLSDKKETPETLQQRQELDKIHTQTTYPSVEAIFDPERVTLLLSLQTDSLIKVLKMNNPTDRETTENIQYLETKYKPNITNHQYWCPEQYGSNGQQEPSSSR